MDSLDRITARAKIAEATSPEEAVSWLTRTELVALLGSPDLLVAAGADPRFRGVMTPLQRG